MQSFLFKHIPALILCPILLTANTVSNKNKLPIATSMEPLKFNSYSLYQSEGKVPPLAYMHFNMGATFAEEGQNELAIDAFKSALKEHPDYVGAMLAIDICYRELASNPRPDFSKLSVDSNAPLADQHFTRAKKHIVNEDIAAAIIDFEKALDVNPQHFKAQYNLGIAYSLTGKIQDAINSYKKSIQLNTENYLAWESMGVVYSRLGDEVEAIRCFKKAVFINPGLASAHHSLGILNNIDQKKDVALENFKMAVALQPNNPMYREHLEELIFIE